MEAPHIQLQPAVPPSFEVLAKYLIERVKRSLVSAARLYMTQSHRAAVVLSIEHWINIRKVLRTISEVL